MEKQLIIQFQPPMTLYKTVWHDYLVCCQMSIEDAAALRASLVQRKLLLSFRLVERTITSTDTVIE